MSEANNELKTDFDMRSSCMPDCGVDVEIHVHRGHRDGASKVILIIVIYVEYTGLPVEAGLLFCYYYVMKLHMSELSECGFSGRMHVVCSFKWHTMHFRCETLNKNTYIFRLKMKCALKGQVETIFELSATQIW